MNQFYISIIFIGILLIGIALVWVAYDIKRGNDYEKRMDKKKNELIEIINDSEQMIDELNRFSDYVLTQIDNKSSSMESAEGEVLSVSHEEAEQVDLNSVSYEKVVNGNPIETNGSIKKYATYSNKKKQRKQNIEDGVESIATQIQENIEDKKQNIKAVIEENMEDSVEIISAKIEDKLEGNIEKDEEIVTKREVNGQIKRSHAKVIPLDSRYKEVIRLYEDGMDDTQIARTLKMGKGEIQLILGMNR